MCWYGGEHARWCLRKVATLLRAAGHDVLTPTLTGLGEPDHLMSPAVDPAMHVTDVANTLVFDDLREVILVGHGYGGRVITGASDSAQSLQLAEAAAARSLPRTNIDCTRALASSAGEYLAPATRR